MKIHKEKNKTIVALYYLKIANNVSINIIHMLYLTKFLRKKLILIFEHFVNQTPINKCLQLF